MAEEENLTQLPLTAPTQPTPPMQRKLNWRAFLLGIVVVIGIEWFALHAVGSSSPELAPTISPSKVPSPTQQMTAHWSTYADTAAGFSIQYPADKYTLDAKPAFSVNTLHVAVMKDTDPNINLGNDFAPTEYANVKNSILNGTQFSSLQPGKKDTFKTVTIGVNNFVRVYPADNPGCACDEIAYITRVKNAFLVISMATSISATPSVGITATKTPTQTSKLSPKEYQKQLDTNREKLINEQFGDLEKILMTLKIIKES